MEHESNYDVIVIGSGIGGTTPAILLAKYFKKRVLIIEKHWQFGGLTHGFELDGKMFNPGIHYIGGVNNGSIPDKLLHIITNNRIRWLAMPFRYDSFHFPGFHYAFPSSPDAMIEELSEKFPADARAIRQFIKDTRKAFRFLTFYTSFRSFAPRFLHGLIPLIKKLVGFDPNQTLQDYLDQRFVNQELKNLFSAQWIDHGVKPSEASFMVHAMIFQHYLKGAYYPEGGPTSINEGLKQTAEKYDVSIKLRTEVTEILTQQNKAHGVKVKDADGKEAKIYAKYIISDAGALNTYQKLLSHHSFDFMEKDAAYLSPKYNFFSIYVSLSDSPKKLCFDGANQWIFRTTNHDQDIVSPKNPLFPGFYCITFPSLKAKDPVHHKVEIMTMVDYSAFNKWKDEDWKHRDGKYYALKERITSSIFRDMEDRYPGFMKMISEYDSSSPLTMEKFVSREQGASYGVPYTTNRMQMEWLTNRTPIHNLYLSGQDAFGPGLMAAMMSGVSAAACVLGSAGYLRIMKHVKKHVFEEKTAYHATPIKSIKDETPDAYTIFFEPCDHINHNYEAGQFILLSIFKDGQNVRRSYSLSSSPDEAYPSITIKRIEDGMMSNFIKDQLGPGNILRTSVAKGKFFIPKKHYGKDVILIAAGSGITPVFAILKDTLVNQENNIHLVYAAKTPKTAIFKDQLDQFVIEYPEYFKADYFFSEEPNPNRLSPEKLKEILSQYNLEHTLVYVCAPEGITYMVSKMLQDLSFNFDHFKYESFTTKRLNIHSLSIPSVDTNVTYRISKEEHNASVTKDLTLLEGLLDQNVPIEYSCKNGDCELCSCKIIEGKAVSLQEKRIQNHKTGDTILPCIVYGASENIALESLN